MFIELYKAITPVWHWLLLALDICMVGFAVSHVLLRQRDGRIAAFWAVIIAFVPLLGAIFYAMFGINRIQRRGQKYRAMTEVERQAVLEACPLHPEKEVPELKLLGELAESIGKLSRYNFSVGNHMIPLRSEEAMLAMLTAIRNAKRSISLCSYIFEAKGVGLEFVKELEKAKNRGVEVRVLVDNMGTMYSWPPIIHTLRRRGIRAESFMHSHFFFRMFSMNMRNHRKVMVVDGVTGFTGGMNIRAGNMLSQNPRHPVIDLHFQVEGPAVRQLQRVFAEDWAFCCGEVLKGDIWYPELEAAGEVGIIGVPDGPDEDFELMPKVIFAAINAARREIRVMTPYFLPEAPILWALNSAALRGVDVTIITPKNNNIPFVRWAARTLYPQMLERGVHILEADGHFDHSKFMTIDGLWSLVGSTNWDPRSLRLNFEFNVACFDDILAGQLNAIFIKSLEDCHPLTREELRQAGVLLRLRDGFARLFMPVL
jgi:cardiolipin synthase